MLALSVPTPIPHLHLGRPWVGEWAGRGSLSLEVQASFDFLQLPLRALGSGITGLPV